MAGLFDLVSGDDLCAKLDHDYRRLSKDFSDVFVAFDFIVTAWHLLEWKYPGDNKKSQRTELYKQHPILQLCEHLCVIGKHYEPTNPKHKSVYGSFRNSPWKRGMWAKGVWDKVWKDELIINLSGPVKEEMGEQLTMQEFADYVMQFWRESGGCPPESNVGGSAI